MLERDHRSARHGVDDDAPANRLGSCWMAAGDPFLATVKSDPVAAVIRAPSDAIRALSSDAATGPDFTVARTVARRHFQHDPRRCAERRRQRRAGRAWSRLEHARAGVAERPAHPLLGGRRRDPDQTARRG